MSARRQQPGRVTLVGAGPGDPELLTIAGARALASADVVLYDRLVDERVVALAPRSARRIAVGKQKGGGTSQDEINDLLVVEALAGGHVVRLKGGDPFLFGRGGEEVQALAVHGIVTTVVPGVSAALAAPAAAGIPVTHRGVASSVTIVSGHLVDDAGADPVDGRDWAAIAAAPGTLVVLMAASTAAAVASGLLAAGRRDEPVAVVHAATTGDQQVARSTLRRLARSGSPFPAPSVLVIGPVADPTALAALAGPGSARAGSVARS